MRTNTCRSASRRIAQAPGRRYRIFISLVSLILLTVHSGVAPVAAQSATAQYQVRPGDTLAAIARRFNTSIASLMILNHISNPNLLFAGQVLLVSGQPTAGPMQPAQTGQLLPDSELVYGPAFVNFDIAGEIRARGGYLSQHVERVEDRDRTGPEIVQMIAQRFSVGPRILLAVLEYRAGWLTNPRPADSTWPYPLGKVQAKYEGLFHQLEWAANRLNQGFYGYRDRGLASLTLTDGAQVLLDRRLNAGTIALQQLVSLTADRVSFVDQLGSDGIMKTYRALWGDPFQYAVPLLPATLYQPVLKLPFAPGLDWYLTGGPHGGWGSGSAWAAVDFAPGLESCRVDRAYWDVAAASGRILRADNGEVIQELDADGHEQTGWVLLYMHVADEDRVQAGTYVKTGQRLGHPSCQGGFSTGSHVHFARRYNGVWMAAAGRVPLVLSGWLTHGQSEYNGSLTRNGQRKSAYGGKSSVNRMRSDNAP